MQFVTDATPKWTFFTFGIISILLWAVPVVLFVFGARMRAKSRFAMSDALMRGHSYNKVAHQDESTAYDPGH